MRKFERNEEEEDFWDVERNLRGSDGKSNPALISGSLLRDEAGLPSGAVLVAKDITERKRAEETLQYLSFEAGIAEMGTAVLHNIGNAITGISSQAQKLTRSAGDLLEIADALERRAEAGAVADAPKTLVEAAAALRELAQQELIGSAGTIHAGVRHVAEIVRLQQNSALRESEPQAVLVKGLLEDALNLLADTLEKEGVGVEVEVDPRQELRLPRNPCLQMLINLLKNSVEAVKLRQESETVAGAIRVTEQQTETHYALHFRDNGAGIAADRLETIFHYGSSTKPRGTGVGLHSAALFMQGQGGSIEARSGGINQGATLILRFPIKMAEFLCVRPSSVALPP